MFVANPPQRFQESRGRGHVSTFTLHRFDHNRRDFFRRRSCLEQKILDPIRRALHDTAVAAIFGIEWIAIFVWIRHVHDIQHLPLESDALRRF